MRTLSPLAVVGLLFLAACLGLFGVPWTAGTLVVVAVLVGARSRLCWLLPALLLGWRVPLVEYADRVDALVQDEAWTGRDRAGVWVLNMGMALTGGALGLPEVALETAWLALPDEDGVRRLPSDFAMGSPGVRRAIRAQVALLPARPDHPRALRPQQVRFPYDPALDSVRVALALNPVALSGTAVPVGEGWRLDLEARVPVTYPRRYLLVLFELDGRAIGIEEGLYGRLQDEGWLFPYEMVWTWSLDADDPRLGVDWGGGPVF